MSILEKKSKRKALAIRKLVENGEYSIQYALNEVEALNDNGLLLDADYEPLAEWLEEKLEPTVVEAPEEEIIEDV